MSEVKRSLLSRILRGILDILDIILFSIVNFFLTFYYLVKMMFPSKKKNIRGQLALITGGGNGLGRAISFALAELGCNIIILDIDMDAAEKTASDIRHKHNSLKVHVFMVDVSKYDEVQHVRQRIENEIGEVDILINNAGLLPEISLLEGSAGDIEKIISVNLVSSFWTIREFIKAMHKRNSGHIVVISSLAGLEALGRQAAYSSTKYGLRGLVESLQEELRMDESKIVVTAIYPGFIKTRPHLLAYMDRSLKNPSSLVFLSPEETADAVVSAIVTNKFSVTIPRYQEFLINVSRSLPKEIRHRCNDKFKPMLYKNSNVEVV